MDGFKAYIITVIACVLVSSLALSVSPEGAIRKHLRFLFGIIFTAVLLTPMANGMFSRIEVPELSLGMQQVDVSQETLKKVMREQSEELSKGKMEQLIADSAGLRVEQVEVKMKNDGNIEQITLKNAQPYNADKASARLGINREIFTFKR